MYKQTGTAGTNFSQVIENNYAFKAYNLNH